MPFSKNFDRLFRHQEAVEDTPRRVAIRKWRKQTNVTLSHLEEEFDPLIARSVFNIRNSTALYRLPDEIWLSIITCLYYNDTEFFMLRQVCRRFRNLMEGPEFSDHRFTSRHHCARDHCNGQEIFCKSSGFLPPKRPSLHPNLIQSMVDVWLQTSVGDLLHVDTLCAQCIQRARMSRVSSSKCKFYHEWLETRCHSGTSRPRVAPLKSRPWRKSCVGTKGYVSLCAHETITWKEVKKHLLKCREMIVNDKYLEEYTIVIKQCEHPSHQTATCRESTGPISTLVFDRSGAYTLNLQWRPHSGIGSFPSYKPGKFKASEMRDKFREYRRQGAQLIVPEMAPGQLPEMTCFPFGECDCLSYGDDEETNMVLYGSTKDNLHHQVKTNPDHEPLSSSNEPHLSNVHNFACRSQVKLERCSLPEPVVSSLSPCIVTDYRRCIEGCFLVTEKAPIPSHAWLHAMDRASYHWGRKALQSMETCKTPGCRNSYTLSVYGCYERSFDMLWGELATVEHY